MDISLSLMTRLEPCTQWEGTLYSFLYLNARNSVFTQQSLRGHAQEQLHQWPHASVIYTRLLRLSVKLPRTE